VYWSYSPDGKSAVRVDERACFGDCTVRITVEIGGKTKRIGTGSDCWVKFVHSAWSGSTVSVFVDGVVCGQLKVAYDAASGKLVDFGSTEAWLKKDLISTYSVTADELKMNDGDVFKWAIYPGDGKFRRSMFDFDRRFRKK
jgi:hypothetical protein